MIDPRFQTALSQISNSKRQGIKQFRTLLCIAVLSATVGVLVGHQGLVRMQIDISDDSLGHLAALAACSTGQSPAVEWERAQSEVSFLDQILGQPRVTMVKYFLSIIDTDRCVGTHTASTQHDEIV